MYLEFFQLWAEPFGVTPDPAYLYPSQTHLKALDSLRGGILGGRGFMTLIAEPGMGKTTLLYQLIEQLPQTTRTAYLFQTQCNSIEFMQYLLSELGIDPAGMGLVAMHRRLNEMLFDEMVHGKQFLLVVDESQNLSNAVLETVRLLSNFETSHSKLLQIVLAGQPELANKLRQPELSQLLQRITVMANLDAFTFEETAAYIRHRLKLAGHAGEDLFDPAGLAAVFRRSQGIPRNINRICHAALSLAQEEQTRVVTAALVERSNRGLGSVLEDFQKSGFASQPPQPAAPRPPAQTAPPTAVPNAPANRMSPSPPVESVSPTAVPSPAAGSFVPEPEASPGFQTRVQSESQPVPTPQIPPPALPEFVPPEPPRRSYRWLAWTVAFVAVPVLVALAAPASVRQALLQKIQPIVASTVSSDDPRPASTPAKNTVPAPAVQRPMPTNNSGNDGAKTGATTKGLKIVIDPGHGGIESGTRGPNGLLEKSVCLEVALRLGQMIEDNLPGAEVIYTRSDDQNLSAQHRAAIANESLADLFISIHADSLDGQGLQVYYADAGPEKKSVGPVNARKASHLSSELADDVQKALKDGATPMHAPADPAFAVLNSVQVPAVVAEIPFSGSDSPLLDPAQRQRLAESLYRGIAAFLKSAPDRSAR